MVDNDKLINFKEDHTTMYNILFVHHTLISAYSMVFGVVLFTLSLRKGQYKYQFKRFGWIIMASLVPITSPMLLAYYVYKGFFWMIICNGSVMINDVMAYVFGKSFGRTQLIKLSPNKTWEGFIGGGISTILFAMLVSTTYSCFLFICFNSIFLQIAGQISNNPYVYCPQNEIIIKPFQSVQCERPLIYE